MKWLLYVIYVFLIISCSHDIKQSGKGKTVDIRVTAYHPFEHDHLKYKNRSALGNVLQKDRHIAADWSVFPVGTKLKFNAHIYEVCDYGSALVKPEHTQPTVDLYVANKSEMNRWGVKYFNKVEVIEWGSYYRSMEILQDRLKYTHCRTMYNRIQKKL